MDPTDWAALEHLLTSNIAPLHHEHAIAQRVINELDTELTTLDERTSNLQQELKRLAARKLVIKDHRHRCAGIISARRRLPPEVTQVIMGALWSRALHNGSHQPSQSPIPRLMLVSREWHNIALATPHFWADLFLDLLLRAETTVKGAGTWLSRAQGHPLSLGILIEEADSCHTWFIQFLKQWAPRIAVLKLNMTQYSLDVAVPVPRLQNIIWPELHTLSIHSRLNPLMGDGTDHQLVDYKPSAKFPALRNVNILTMVSAPIFSMMGIPWSNLVFLRVYIDHEANVDGNNQYLAMLRECSGRLEEYSMAICRHIPLPLQGSTEPIIFPRLTRLHICAGVDLMSEEWVVDHLRFPALRSIAYHLPYTTYSTRNPIDAITSLVRSSGATKSIQYFELRDNTVRIGSEGPSVRMEGFLEDLQNLEHLRIYADRSDFECPKHIPKSLRRLYVAVREFVEGREKGESDWLKLEETLRELSETRRNLGCPLEVELDICGQLKEIA